MSLLSKLTNLNHIWADKSYGLPCNAENRLGLWETAFTGFKMAMDSMALTGYWLIWPNSTLPDPIRQQVIQATEDQYYYVLVKIDPKVLSYRKGDAFQVYGSLHMEDVYLNNPHQLGHVLQLVEEARQAAHRWMLAQL